MADRHQVAVRRRLATHARGARLNHGWTQERAAEKLGCSVQQLRRLERAATNSSVDFVARLASVYRVDVIELFAPIEVWRNPRRGRPSGASSTD